MRPPIYKNKSYNFQLEILVNGVPVDIRSDVVTLYLDKDFNKSSPAITLAGDVTTLGISGKVIFEITPTLSNVAVGRYNIQAVWTLAGDTRSFLVLDDVIDVRDVIKV